MIPGLGRCPGEGRGYPLQYSGLENTTDYVVHGVAESRTRLSDVHFQSQVSQNHNQGSLGSISARTGPQIRLQEHESHVHCPETPPSAPHRAPPSFQEQVRARGLFPLCESECQLLCRVQPLVTPWTAARQAPPSMGFSRQEYWRGLPCPPPGIKLGSFALYPIPKCNFRTAPITEDVFNKHFLKLAGRCLSQK